MIGNESRTDFRISNKSGVESNELVKHPIRILRGEVAEELLSIIFEYKHESLFVGRGRYK
jgi:hypothetical protein